MARHWDGKKRKDLKEEGRDRNRAEEQGGVSVTLMAVIPSCEFFVEGFQ